MIQYEAIHTKIFIAPSGVGVDQAKGRHDRDLQPPQRGWPVELLDQHWRNSSSAVRVASTSKEMPYQPSNRRTARVRPASDMPPPRIGTPVDLTGRG